MNKRKKKKKHCKRKKLYVNYKNEKRERDGT